LKTKLITFISVLFLVFSFPVFGQGTTGIVVLENEPLLLQEHDRDLRWTLTEPVEREDGTELASDEIFGYVFNCYHPSNDTAVERIVHRDLMTIEDGNALYTWQNAVPQGIPYFCRAKTLDVSERESEWSNVVQLEIEIQTPFGLRVR